MNLWARTILPLKFYSNLFFSRRSNVGNKRFVVLCSFCNIWMSILIDFCALSSNPLKFLEKNPRCRRYLSRLWKLVFTLKFSKIKIFQKKILRFVWLLNANKSWKKVYENNSKWRRKPRWRISVFQFLKNSNKPTVKDFSIF